MSTGRTLAALALPLIVASVWVVVRVYRCLDRVASSPH